MEIALEKLSKEALIALIGKKDVLLKERNATIEQQHTQIIQKESEIAKLRRMLFGQKRERFESSPLQLPIDVGCSLSEEDIAALHEAIAQKAEKVREVEKKVSSRPHLSHCPLPQHSPETKIKHDPLKYTTNMV